MAARLRLDQLVVERGLTDTRSKAQALILAGRVYSGEARLDKPGTQVRSDIELTVRGETRSWVSRGAHKLIAGLDAFAIDPSGCIALDIGASTGGFTEVLLNRGAAHVFAVDVGHGQLDYRLRNDPRVTVLERTNARSLTREHVPEAPSLVVCDTSFIGLQTVLPAPLALCAPECSAVLLVKPQFQATRSEVGKGGVVRDEAVHARVCDEAASFMRIEGWQILGITPSPITGPAGNREFLLGAVRPPRASAQIPLQDQK